MDGINLIGSFHQGSHQILLNFMDTTYKLQILFSQQNVVLTISEDIAQSKQKGLIRDDE